MSEIHVKCSAVVWPAPGPGSCAHAIARGGQILALRAAPYGFERWPVTQNSADLQALILALQELDSLGMKGAQVMSCSQRVVAQIADQAACESPLIEQQRQQVKSLLIRTQSSLFWIPGQQNQFVEALALRCLPAASAQEFQQKMKRKHA